MLFSLSSSNRTFVEQFGVDGRGIGVSCCRWPVNGGSYGDRSRVAGRQEWMDTWAVGRIGGLTDMHVKVEFDEGKTERKRMT